MSFLRKYIKASGINGSQIVISPNEGELFLVCFIFSFKFFTFLSTRNTTVAKNHTHTHTHTQTHIYTDTATHFSKCAHTAVSKRRQLM